MPQCTARVDKHFAGYCSLQLATRGLVSLRYDQQVHTLQAPSCWACMPGPRIRFRSACPGQSWNHRYVAFRGGLVDLWRNEGIWPPAPGPVESEVDRLVENFNRMLDAALGPGQRRVDHLRAVNLLEGILLQIAPETKSAAMDDPDAIDCIADRLASEPTRRFDYEALAEEFGISLSTLRKRFRKKMGLPIHQFVIQARLAQARKLLLTGSMPIKVVASQLGFRDVYYFSRQFKKLTGVAPGQFRRTGAI
jgi:AraC-like DNA-binding protein